MVLALSKGPEHPKKLALFCLNLKKNKKHFFNFFLMIMSTYVDVGEHFITTCRQRKWLPTTALDILLLFLYSMLIFRNKLRQAFPTLSWVFFYYKIMQAFKTNSVLQSEMPFCNILHLFLQGICNWLAIQCKYEKYISYRYKYDQYISIKSYCGPSYKEQTFSCNRNNSTCKLWSSVSALINVDEHDMTNRISDI